LCARYGWSHGLTVRIVPASGSAATVMYTIDVQSDRLTAVVGGAEAGSVSYDVNGNTTLMPARALAWTAQNRVTSITTTSGVTVDYGLDPLGRTLTRVTSGSGVAKSATHHYAADADSPSWTTDVDGGSETTTRYVSGGGGMLAMQQVDGQTVYPLYTPHGDMWAITDTGGNVIVTFDFDEYDNPAQAPTGYEELDRYGWLGKQQRESDPEVGITLIGVRGYDPTLGRFLSVDPVYGGSANGYDYTAGDPINGYDLDGRAKSSGPKLSKREVEELQKKKAGKPYDKRIVNQAEKKIRAQEKYRGERQSNIWAAAGAAAVAVWVAAKWLSPACGPALPVCAVVL